MLPVGKCSTPYVFGIRAVDKYGNHRKAGKDSFRVQMMLLAAANNAPSAAVPSLQGLVTDNNDGTYLNSRSWFELS